MTATNENDQNKIWAINLSNLNVQQCDGFRENILLLWEGRENLSLEGRVMFSKEAKLESKCTEDKLSNRTSVM